MIAIVDYGVGNLRSVQKAFEYVGFAAEVTADAAALAEAEAIVLPGVGAFGAAAANLRASGLLPAVLQVVQAGRPFLGICVGMQLLFDYSEEQYCGEIPKGLGLLHGSVKRFPPGMKVPQIGWNQLQITQGDRLFAGVPENAHVYFVHSYYCHPDDTNCVAAKTEYGISFCAAVQQDNVMAIQFHPEKSGRVGLQILRNFGEYTKSKI